MRLSSSLKFGIVLLVQFQLAACSDRPLTGPESQPVVALDVGIADPTTKLVLKGATYGPNYEDIQPHFSSFECEDYIITNWILRWGNRSWPVKSKTKVKVSCSWFANPEGGQTYKGGEAGITFAEAEGPNGGTVIADGLKSVEISGYGHELTAQLDAQPWEGYEVGGWRILDALGQQIAFYMGPRHSVPLQGLPPNLVFVAEFKKQTLPPSYPPPGGNPPPPPTCEVCEPSGL
jgi:hypothetical protein